MSNFISDKAKLGKDITFVENINNKGGIYKCKKKLVFVSTLMS